MEKFSTKWLVQVAVLAAIIVVMSVTPIGYLKVGAIEITFLMIPVVVGAIVLGPKAGTILGLVFGVTSFAQCFGTSPFGTTLMGIQPIYTFIVCIVPRVLMGLLSALAFVGLHKVDKTPAKAMSFSLASVTGPLLNTLLFVGGVFLFFWNSEFITGLRDGRNILAFFVWFVGINGVIEAIVTFVIGGAISRAVYKVANR